MPTATHDLVLVAIVKNDFITRTSDFIACSDRVGVTGSTWRSKSLVILGDSNC